MYTLPNGRGSGEAESRVSVGMMGECAVQVVNEEGWIPHPTDLVLQMSSCVTDGSR